MTHDDTTIRTANDSPAYADQNLQVITYDGAVTIAFDIDLDDHGSPAVMDGLQIDDPLSLLRLAEVCLSAAAHRLSSDNRLNLHPLSDIDPAQLDAERHRLRTTAARVELVASEWSRLATLTDEAYTRHIEATTQHLGRTRQS